MVQRADSIVNPLGTGSYMKNKNLSAVGMKIASKQGHYSFEKIKYPSVQDNRDKAPEEEAFYHE
jgi:hypothetical protein